MGIFIKKHNSKGKKCLAMTSAMPVKLEILTK